MYAFFWPGLLKSLLSGRPGLQLIIHKSMKICDVGQSPRWHNSLYPYLNISYG